MEEDDGFPSILPPFLPDSTDYAINQWGACVRPRVYDFPIQVCPVSEFAVAVDESKRLLKEEPFSEMCAESKSFMPLVETYLVRRMKLVDPIIPGQLMSKLYRGKNASRKNEKLLGVAINPNESDLDTPPSNTMACESFEFEDKSYVVSFFGKFMGVFLVNNADGSLEQVVHTEIRSTIRSISVSKDSFSWAPPATSVGNIYILCLTDTEVYLFQFREGNSLKFLSSIGFKCGVSSAIIAFVDHPSIVAYVMTKSGLVQWDFNGKNNLSILSLDSPTFKADCYSFKSEEIVSIRRNPDRSHMLLVVTTKNVHLFDSRTLSRPIASFVGKNYRETLGVFLLDRIDVSKFLGKKSTSEEARGTASVLGIVNSNTRVPILKLQMMLCEKTILENNAIVDKSYDSTSEEELMSSLKHPQKKKLLKKKSMDLPFEESVNVFSLSKQTGVKIPYNTLNIRLRHYEPFTRVSGICSCAATSPSEFYLYMRTDTKIYMQKWQVTEYKEGEEPHSDKKAVLHETYEREETEGKVVEFVPIPSTRLVRAIEKEDRKYPLKEKVISSLDQWFKDTLSTPLTLEELCHKLEEKLGTGGASIDADELQKVIQSSHKLDFISFLSLDKLCHSCNSKSECTCFYDGGEDLPPWKIICYAGKDVTESMTLNNELDDNAKKIVELCNIFVESRPDLYRPSMKNDAEETQKPLTEEEVMEVVMKSLQTQEQGMQTQSNDELLPVKKKKKKNTQNELTKEPPS